MKVALAADHAGLDLKNGLVKYVKKLGHEVIDLGAYGYDAEDDYPDFASAVAISVQSGKTDRGILACGSGVGASITANKFGGIRAAICHDTYSASQGVNHDDMNVLCVGGRIIGMAVAKELIFAFLNAEFDPVPRFSRRLKKLMDIESQNISGTGGTSLGHK